MSTFAGPGNDIGWLGNMVAGDVFRVGQIGYRSSYFQNAVVGVGAYSRCSVNKAPRLRGLSRAGDVPFARVEPAPGSNTGAGCLE